MMNCLLQINPNSKAYTQGIKVGDYIDGINRQRTHGLNHGDAQKLIKNATDELLLELRRFVVLVQSVLIQSVLIQLVLIQIVLIQLVLIQSGIGHNQCSLSVSAHTVRCWS